VLKVPYIALDTSDELAKLAAMDFAACERDGMAFWRAELKRGAQVKTPEPRLNLWHYAHLGHVQIADTAMPGQQELISTSVGTSVYANYCNEACMLIQDLDERGLHDEARRRLSIWLKYQGTSGLNGNFTDHNGVFFGAGGFEAGANYNQHHGWVLWCLANHYFESGDKAWIKVSADGANWSTLREFVDGVDDTIYRFYEIDVPKLGDTLYVRFDAGMNQPTDYWYIDDVRLVGTTRGAPPVELPNKFYVIDLAPGRSMVEFLVQQGIQVFVVSWRNPDARHRDWGFDSYARAILDALDGVQRVTGAEGVVLYGACSGGVVSAMTAAHLAASGDANRLAGLTLVVTVLDQSRAGLVSAIVDRRTADAAAAVSARKGYLDGRTLAEVFAWLRPGDLIWNYWVNNYLLGKSPPAFDILFWNADVTRMPARLHRDFLELAVENVLTKPGQAQLLGSPVDLSAVKTDAYVLAGVADHLCDWESCYRTVHLLGGDTRFVLSTSGHVAAIVNPPGNPKANYQVSQQNPEEPAEFVKTAQRADGTWWTDYVEWLRERCGPERPALTELGGGGLQPLSDAPGTYVLES
jgi:poly(3-hydroxyalkanoate) synthetase